ncbi:MAG: ribokinase [Planctomycetia bacterium]|nr:ribokinase [Planctomycetia bacterium]
MKKPKIVVIGSSNTDMVVKSDRIPVPGETITGGSFLLAQGGKGANQAVAAARLGAEVLFVTRVGNDMFGREAVEQYQREGIDTSFIEVDATAATGVALILVDAKGENLISVASGANHALYPEQIDRASEAIGQADLVILQLEIPLATVEYAVALCNKLGVPVILDPAPAPRVPLPDSVLKGIATIKPNETEASALTGMPVTDSESAEKSAQFLLDKGAKSVIITLGTQGVFAISACGERAFVPSFSVSAVDSTAAGDCFSAAYAVATVQGHSLSDAIRFAAAAAAISVTRIGAQGSLPTLAEVNEFLTQHSAF